LPFKFRYYALDAPRVSLATQIKHGDFNLSLSAITFEKPNHKEIKRKLLIQNSELY